MNYHAEHGLSQEEAPPPRRLEELLRRLEAAGLGGNPMPEGMQQEFVDSLERVPKNTLTASDECPICAVPFLEDPYPLVVALPCPGSHRFDLECVAKWLKSSGTCPMCRHDFNATKRECTPVVDSEEEYDDMYA